ncbi:MAG: hypothetical protein MHM6MM_006392 [Cercozoa sp. M6MM]
MGTRSVLVQVPDDQSDDSDVSAWETESDDADGLQPEFAVNTRSSEAHEIVSTLQQKLMRLEDGVEGEEQGIHDYLLQLVCEGEQHLLSEVFNLSLAPTLSRAHVERLILCRNSEGHTVPQRFVMQNDVAAMRRWRRFMPMLADPTSSLLTTALNSGSVELINVLVSPNVDFKSSLRRPLVSAETLRACFELTFDMVLRGLNVRSRHLLDHLFPASEFNHHHPNNDGLFMLAVPLHRPDYLTRFFCGDLKRNADVLMQLCAPFVGKWLVANTLIDWLLGRKHPSEADELFYRQAYNVVGSNDVCPVAFSLTDTCACDLNEIDSSRVRQFLRFILQTDVLRTDMAKQGIIRGDTPLHVAAASGDPEKLEFILRSEWFGPNAGHACGQTPLERLFKSAQDAQTEIQRRRDVLIMLRNCSLLERWKDRRRIRDLKRRIREMTAEAEQRKEGQMACARLLVDFGASIRVHGDWNVALKKVMQSKIRAVASAVVKFRQGDREVCVDVAQIILQYALFCPELDVTDKSINALVENEIWQSTS